MPGMPGAQSEVLYGDREVQACDGVFGRKYEDIDLCSFSYVIYCDIL
jgi:hypothetical protein